MKSAILLINGKLEDLLNKVPQYKSWQDIDVSTTWQWPLDDVQFQSEDNSFATNSIGISCSMKINSRKGQFSMSGEFNPSKMLNYPAKPKMPSFKNA